MTIVHSDPDHPAPPGGPLERAPESMSESTSEALLELSDQLPPWDQPVAYMQRTRDWYLALGYDTPYVWAHHRHVPYTPLRRPLAQARVALVTTAAPYQADKGPQGPGAPYNAAAKFYEVYTGSSDADPDLRIAHVAIDRKHADMADVRAWFPLAALRRARDRGRIGQVSPRYYGVPTNRSQQHTRELDAPRVLQRLAEDAADCAVLVPNCPVCHQTVSLVARHLEAHGVATVIMGAARDIVEHCGVPRLMFSDFPLGNAAGRPNDPVSQEASLELALRVLESAPAARTTVQSPLRWPGPPDWRLDYCNVDRVDPRDLARLREENERARLVARALRESG